MTKRKTYAPVDIAVRGLLSKIVSCGIAMTSDVVHLPSKLVTLCITESERRARCRRQTDARDCLDMVGDWAGDGDDDDDDDD